MTVVEGVLDDNDGSNSSSSWSEKALEGQESHVYLLDTLKATIDPNGSGLVTQEVIDRAAISSLRFQKTVCQLLDLTRVISFC